MSSVLVTTEVLRDAPGGHVDLLAASGYDVRFPAKSALLTENDVLEAAQGFTAIIAGSEPYSARVLAELPALRIISRNGVGYDQIDVPAATRRGVAVTITADANHQAVAEHTLALMLAAARSVVSNSLEVHRGTWQRRGISIPLRGRSLGIVGLGRIGRSVAVRAAGFGMRLMACETAPDREFIQRYGIELVDFNTLLTQADFVTLHTPMTPETQQLINARTLGRMKRGSVLVNTSRGGLINERDLHEALVSGHLAGAALDVLATEPPPPDHPLLALDNVVFSPHVAALDEQAVADMATGAAQNILDVFAGNWPLGSLMNPEVQAVWKV